MRGEIIYKILLSLENTAIGAIDLIEVLATSGYGASMDKIEYKLSRKNEERLEEQIRNEKIIRIKKYLSKLKSDGLVSDDSLNKISLTKKGREKLNKLKKSFLLSMAEYKKEPSTNVIVISYDIPVSFNLERDALRDILRFFGFNLIHKSVWIGKTKLPEEFVVYLGNAGILEYVEILEVTKNGSLKSIN